MRLRNAASGSPRTSRSSTAFEVTPSYSQDQFKSESRLHELECDASTGSGYHAHCMQHLFEPCDGSVDNQIFMCICKIDLTNDHVADLTCAIALSSSTADNCFNVNVAIGLLLEKYPYACLHRSPAPSRGTSQLSVYPGDDVAVVIIPVLICRI